MASNKYSSAREGVDQHVVVKGDIALPLKERLAVGLVLVQQVPVDFVAVVHAHAAGWEGADQQVGPRVVSVGGVALLYEDVMPDVTHTIPLRHARHHDSWVLVLDLHAITPGIDNYVVLDRGRDERVGAIGVPEIQTQPRVLNSVLADDPVPGRGEGGDSGGLVIHVVVMNMEPLEGDIVHRGGAKSTAHSADRHVLRI